MKRRKPRGGIFGIRPSFKLVLFFFIVAGGLYSFSSFAGAQPKPSPPDPDYLFLEDQKKKEKKDKASVEAEAIKKKKKDFANVGKSGKLPFDVNAKQISFDSTGNKLLADGGLIIKYSSMVLEAVKGVVDLTTNQATISGDVRISDISGVIQADSAHFDLDDGTGKMENAEVFFSAGEFQLKAKELGKASEETYTLKEGTLTTCQCNEGDDCPPWRIRANEAEIVRNGYGQAWGAKLDVLNVPILYTPYLIFPAKTERQSGFLPFTYGAGRRSGFDLVAPFFWAINDSTDMTIQGIYESEVRYGTDIELRKVFSRQSDMQAGFIFFDEAQRDGDLLGTDTSGLADPTLDEQRFGAYLDQNWRGSAGAVPLQLVTRGKYVSDDLFLREYENDNIGPYNSRFVTSQMSFRAPIASSLTLDVLGEFNQSLAEEDDDFVFQRLPEAEATGINVFRPFGDNPFGAKLVSTTSLNAVNFARKEGYDGIRAELYESLKVPFYFHNFFDAQLEGNVRASQYELDETRIITQSNPNPENPLELKSSSDRVVPGLNYKMGTVLERVFQLEEGNLIKTLGELGTIGRKQQLARVKHTLEPGIRYKYVPDVDQDDNPQFDSLDHLAQKNVITYQLTQRLFGRYEPRDNYLYGIEETTPDIESLGSLRSSSPLDDTLMFGFAGDDGSEDFTRLRSGSLRELATFKLSQSYDFLDPDELSDSENGEEVRQLSDIASDLMLYPNEYVYFRGKMDFDAEDQEFSAYLLESQLEDKRGDRIRARFRDVKDQVRQLEGNVELKITDAVRMGYYARYDDLEGEFIETKVGLRYISQCNCWIFDVDFSDRINPDETRVTFNITLVGLGELNQHFFPGYAERQKRERASRAARYE